jgi:ubiquinone/menaquinone biosynthesis C-methylase UbiE
MSPAMDYSHLAQLYDTYASFKIDIPFYLNEARQQGGQILELMSGTGRVSLPLIENGFQLTCVDSSSQMLQVLRDKLAAQKLTATVLEMDVRELDLGKAFDLAFIPFNSFSELVSTTDQMKALSRIKQHLSPQGRFICTLHNPPIRLRQVDGQLRLWSSNPLPDRSGKLVLWGAEKYQSESGVVSGLQLFETYDTEGLFQSRRMAEIQFAVIEKETFEQLAFSAGFSVAALYGDYAYTEYSPSLSPYMIYILKHL